MSSLVGKKVKDKEILVYLFCTGKLKGDDYKTLWNKKKFKEPYKGKPKLEKRLSSKYHYALRIKSFLTITPPTIHKCGTSAINSYWF